MSCNGHRFLFWSFQLLDRYAYYRLLRQKQHTLSGSPSLTLTPRLSSAHANPDQISDNLFVTYL
jgi:hypothetical protein